MSDTTLPRIRTPIGIKVYGPELGTIQSIGEHIEAILPRVPGTRRGRLVLLLVHQDLQPVSGERLAAGERGSHP